MLDVPLNIINLFLAHISARSGSRLRDALAVVRGHCLPFVYTDYLPFKTHSTHDDTNLRIDFINIAPRYNRGISSQERRA